MLDGNGGRVHFLLSASVTFNSYVVENFVFAARIVIICTVNVKQASHIS